MLKQSLALVLAGGMVAGVTVGSVHAAPKKAGMMMMTEKLKPMNHSMVTGTAKFMYNSKRNMTTVKLMVMHLKPGTLHPAHIHVGRCGGNGKVIEPLGVVKANAKGFGMTTTTFKGSPVHKMWYINVHMGPDLAGKHFTVLACANVM